MPPVTSDYGMNAESDWMNAAHSTGTSIMAAEFNGGVIIGADSRTTTGAYIANRVTDKLTKVTDHIYCCRSGSAADTQAIADIVAYHLSFHGMELGEEPLVETGAAVFRELCYNYRDSLMAGILVAGWDKRKGGQVGKPTPAPTDGPGQGKPEPAMGFQQRQRQMATVSTNIVLLCIQLNTNRSQTAHDCLTQMAIEERADILFSGTPSLGAGVGLGASGNMHKDQWLHSPNVPIQQFLEELRKTLRDMREKILLTGDFNAKSHAWGSGTKDRMGSALADLLAELNLVVANVGN
ncbi:Proteasome subunit beta type-6-like Protein [Tribolium castaneum]|uniref:Proteasome subunit beta type-6-like Protein n=1 Tax=Tribolium castaneum TaxID=7070 RepID=A0A139W9W9_TRICA|nr:Proteasome subunit beta type-6-like Protein [Tribolium castaneum]